MLVEMMCLVDKCGTPKEHVAAFLEQMPDHPYPAPHLNLPALEIPPNYAKCVSTDHRTLSARVGDKLDEFLDLTDVDIVVLTYANHGAKVALGEGCEAFSTDAFMGWALAATRADKRLLIVLDACCSTYFAAAIWRQLTHSSVRPDAVRRRKAHVGFLTSSDVDCGTSKVIVSTAQEFVYLFGGVRDGYCPGFLTHNSMFLRQLLYLWAYELTDENLPISRLPETMNEPNSKMKRKAVPHRPTATSAPAPDQLADELAKKRGSLFYGFDASFVGDPEGLGLLPVNRFFPLGQVRSAPTVPGRPDVTFHQVIPPFRLGKLFDDATDFQSGPKERFGFLVIDKDTEGKAVLRMEGGVPFVQIADERNPTLLELVEEYINPRGRRLGEEEEAPKVPWRSFVMVCYRAMDRTQALDASADAGSHRTADMRAFLKELNGEAVPSRYDTFVFWMTLYQYQVGEQTKFLDKIRAVITEIVDNPPAKTKTQ
jgi:hypothetical protein